MRKERERKKWMKPFHDGKKKGFLAFTIVKGIGMNTVITSNEALLEASKKIAKEKGILAISMREVAAKANVAVGSVYNYFPNKATLISETIASIWCDVFYGTKGCMTFTCFSECLKWLMDTIGACSKEYPDFLKTHALGIKEEKEREKSRQMMETYRKHLKEQMLFVLEKDQKVRKEVFADGLQKEDFIDFVFSNVITALNKGERECEILFQIIEKLLY